MKTKCIASIVLAAGIGLLANASEMRTWTSTSGTTTEATFEKYEMGFIHLKLENGRVLKVNRNQLSDSDWRFVEKLDPDFRIVRVKLGESSAKVRRKGQKEMARSETVSYWYTNDGTLEIRRAEGLIAAIPFKDSMLNPFIKHSTSHDFVIAQHSVTTNGTSITFASWTAEAPFDDPQAKMARQFNNQRGVPYNLKVVTNFDAMVKAGRGSDVMPQFVFLTFDSNHPYKLDSSRQHALELLEADPAFQRFKHLKAVDAASDSGEGALDGYKTFERAK